MIPIRTDYRMLHRPWVNWLIIAVNVGLYIAGYNDNSPEGQRRILPLLLQPDEPQLYQFFTCVFLHANWLHLGGNMLFLWIFGNAINDRMGHVGYLLFYLAGGVLASVGYMLLSGAGPLLGASGAIAGVTGAYLVLLPKARVTVLAMLVYVMMPFEVPSLYFIVVQVLINLWMSLHVSGRFAGGVAYAAHSAGYAYGIVIAALLLAIKALPRDPFDLLNLVGTWRRRERYRQMVAQGYDPYHYVRPELRRETPPPAAEPPALPGSGDLREIQLRREISDAHGRGDMRAAAERYLQLVQIADNAVLPRQQQLDVANHLNHSELYPAAADAYERFVRYYPTHETIGDIYLLLGLLYGRYLHQYDRAEHWLTQAVEKLTDVRKLELARGDLQAVRQHRRS